MKGKAPEITEISKPNNNPPKAEMKEMVKI
jgi:hypothetical protein